MTLQRHQNSSHYYVLVIAAFCSFTTFHQYVEMKSVFNMLINFNKESEQSMMRMHIVVAHCKEKLAWMDQLQMYDTAFCQHNYVHIYSKCGLQLQNVELFMTS